MEVYSWEHHIVLNGVFLLSRLDTRGYGKFQTTSFIRTSIAGISGSQAAEVTANHE